MRHKKSPKRNIEADKIYNNVLATRFINKIMVSGKKTVAQEKFYTALDLLKTKEDDNPIEYFQKAVENVMPKVEVKARRVGGANYQVPIEVRPERKTALAVRWIIDAARKRPNKEFKTFEEKLAAELKAASMGEGEAMRKKDLMHKQADANKAFAHFRW
jgi:small subunit ribosomal protein S7